MKHENFKTCEQSGFCTRNRAYADARISSGSSGISPYHLDAKSIKFNNGRLQGIILKRVEASDVAVRLPITITFLQSGTARVTIDEERRQKGEIELRHNSVARKQRYNEAEMWTIVGGLDLSKTATVSDRTEEGITKVLYGPSNNYEAVVRHSPFSVEFKRDEQTHVRFNERGFLNMEHWRAKVETPVKEGNDTSTDVAEDESTWWEETFGGNTDNKPKGPESVGLDITFPGYEHVFGLPEHAGPLSLKETRYSTHAHTLSCFESFKLIPILIVEVLVITTSLTGCTTATCLNMSWIAQ